MQQVKLARPGGLDKLKVVDFEPAAPAAGEIQVSVKASSLNFHDYAVVSGLLPVDEGRIPMSDGAGVVTAIGEGVADFAVGDKVLSCFFPNWQDGGPAFEKLLGVPGDHVDGFAAGSVTMSARGFTRMPANLGYKEAASLTCAGLTAWRALMVEARLKPGDLVLVQGSGGVSVFALQFARMLGCNVIATSSSDKKLQKLSALGAQQLEGGYKAYRRLVVENLGEIPRQLQFRVLCGTTGSAKSRVLQAIARLGEQVLDLEDLACHKGSVLGVLPDSPQPSQKTR